MSLIPTFLARIWRYIRDDNILIKRAVVYFFLVGAVFYLLGAQYPKSDYRRLQNDLEQAWHNNRLYAADLARQKRELGKARARNTLNEKTLALLNGRLDDLLRENLRQKERTLFYQQVFNDETLTGEISIHHLEMSPDFTPQQWRLNAILIRQGKQKKFNGSYYFELVLADSNGEGTMRVPVDNRKFDMNLYYEVEEIIALENDASIEKVRIVVLDAKNKILTSNELLGLGEREDDNGGEMPVPPPSNGVSAETPVNI